jgi:guanylate kinase
MELPKSRESYINSNQTERERWLGRITLWAFVGPTVSGKTTLMNELENRLPNEFVRVVGYTNREIRSNEIDGVDYHFINTEQMRDMHNRGEFLQLECLPSGDVYGTRLDSYHEGRINMFAVAAQALANFRLYGFEKVKPLFIVPDSNLVWRERLNQQGIPIDKIPKRIEEAITSYETALNDDEMQFILSDKIEDALNRIILFINGKKIYDEDRAKITAAINLDKLKLNIR